MRETPYRQLETRFRHLAALRDAAAVLHWDAATMMPRGGAEARGEQLAALAAARHQGLSDPRLAGLIDAAAAPDLNEAEKVNLAEMRRVWTVETAVDERLVRALTRATSACEASWRTARTESDFAAVRPTLEALLALVREAAAAKADRLGVGPYDALLQDYEPGARAGADIDPVFAALEGFLPEFLGRVLDHQAARLPVVRPPGPFPIEAQRALAVRLMTVLGFDFEHGRLDVSAHPFCGGCVDDVRITTRYDESDFTSALMGVLHETGHALYERGLPRAWYGQPAGEPRGMSMHESQSLLIEMQACRSREFLAFAAPLMAEAFGGAGPAWAPDNLYHLYTTVKPGFIRVDADEVTYPAHVILRYRLEKAMVEGDLAVADLPGAWNEGFARLFGRVPPSDREGCLQDIHWYDGAWGYFPTYTLGAMTAAQLFAAAVHANPHIPEALSRGDFGPLLDWLRPHVHARASFTSTRTLLVEATGRPLDARVFEAHLARRYLT